MLKSSVFLKDDRDCIASDASLHHAMDSLADSHQIQWEENDMNFDSEPSVTVSHETMCAIRSAVLDYYGTAAHCIPIAGADLVRVSHLSNEEILQEAMSIPEIACQISLTND